MRYVPSLKSFWNEILPEHFSLETGLKPWILTQYTVRSWVRREGWQTKWSYVNELSQRGSKSLSLRFVDVKHLLGSWNCQKIQKTQKKSWILCNKFLEKGLLSMSWYFLSGILSYQIVQIRFENCKVFIDIASEGVHPLGHPTFQTVKICK